MDDNGPKEDYTLTSRGRRFRREERFLHRLTPAERKAYEECMAILQGIGEDGGLEEACEWLEEYAAGRDREILRP